MPGSCFALRSLTRILCAFLQDASFSESPVVHANLLSFKI